MKTFTSRHIHLVGSKGVAMASLAQMLADDGAILTGSDVAEDFVTQEQLAKLSFPLQIGFADSLPPETELVIYTAAHSGKHNPQVLLAQKSGIPTMSQAEAVATYFNSKKGIAVCGVGGKSTTSAMLTWIFEQLNLLPSYSVGVGAIVGLPATGSWHSDGEYCIAEADEYVIDPTAPAKNEPITPRFSFMHPFITVCTTISFDHPDVYKDFEHTKATFETFFNQIDPNGCLVYNAAQKELALTTSAGTVLTYGTTDADLIYTPLPAEKGTVATITIGDKNYKLELSIPGKYNLENAVAALAVCHFLKLDMQQVLAALATFASTRRRFEFKGTLDGVTYYDDYAHHPREIAAVIEAFNQWEPDKQRVVVFQPHTYSRTKQLFSEFVMSFSQATTVVLLDIFASARETYDASITSQDLATEIAKEFPHITISVVPTVEKLAEYFKTLPENTAVITLGAGDIYHVYDTLLHDEQ